MVKYLAMNIKKLLEEKQKLKLKEINKLNGLILNRKEKKIEKAIIYYRN